MSYDNDKISDNYWIKNKVLIHRCWIEYSFMQAGTTTLSSILHALTNDPDWFTPGKGASILTKKEAKYQVESTRW